MSNHINYNDIFIDSVAKLQTRVSDIIGNLYASFIPYHKDRNDFHGKYKFLFALSVSEIPEESYKAGLFGKYTQYTSNEPVLLDVQRDYTLKRDFISNLRYSLQDALFTGAYVLALPFRSLSRFSQDISAAKEKDTNKKAKLGYIVSQTLKNLATTLFDLVITNPARLATDALQLGLQPLYWLRIPIRSQVFGRLPDKVYQSRAYNNYVMWPAKELFEYDKAQRASEKIEELFNNIKNSILNVQSGDNAERNIENCLEQLAPLLSKRQDKEAIINDHIQSIRNRMIKQDMVDQIQIPQVRQVKQQRLNQQNQLLEHLEEQLQEYVCIEGAPSLTL